MNTPPAMPNPFMALVDAELEAVPLEVRPLLSVFATSRLSETYPPDPSMFVYDTAGEWYRLTDHAMESLAQWARSNQVVATRFFESLAARTAQRSRLNKLQILLRHGNQ